MIADVIVGSSMVFAVGFLVAWIVRPDLKAWLERPKHRFQAHVRDYDRVQCEDARAREGTIR